LQFRSLGKRTGVFSEPSMIEKSAFELADTEKMVEATEKSMAHTVGGATIFSFCRRAFRSAEWKIRC
jgi:hypothetical protein